MHQAAFVRHHNGLHAISHAELLKHPFLGDRIHDNGAAGIRVSASRDLTISRTASYNNHEGVLILDSAGGYITQTLLTANCAGLAVIDTADAGEAPSESGVGIGLVGASGVVVTGNVISDNIASSDPTTGEAAQFSGAGLLLLDASGITGGAAPTDNRIAGNMFLHNEPQDVASDGSGSGNTFADNSCAQSTPASICD